MITYDEEDTATTDPATSDDGHERGGIPSDLDELSTSHSSYVSIMITHDYSTY